MVALSSEAKGYDAAITLCEENGYKYIIYNSFSDCLIALGNGKAEYIVLNELEYESLKLTENDVSFVENVDYKKDFSAVFSENNSALFLEFNEAVKFLKSNGTLQKVKNGYLNGERTDIIPASSYKGELNVLCCADFENRVFYSADGELTGLDIYLAEAVITYLGYSPVFIECEFDEMFYKLENGEGDLIFSAVEYTDERNQNYLLTESYYSEEYSVYEKSRK